MAYEQLKLENQLCFPLYAAARKVVSLYTPYLKPLRLTYTQYITFMVLFAKDGLTIGDLCERLYLDTGTVTPLIKRMEQQGYVERKRSLKDERIVHIFLTSEGREMEKKLKDIPEKVGACLPVEKKDGALLYEALYSILNHETGSI